MNNIDLMNYWVNSADNDYETMDILYKNQKNTWCLFVGHLVIEKLLKAYMQRITLKILLHLKFII